MYSFDTETVAHELVGQSSYQLLPAGDRYILGVSVQQSGTASTSELQCGTTSVMKNYGKDFPFNTTNYHCTQAISISKTGQDSAFFIMSYLPANQYPKILIASVSGEMNIASPSAYAIGQSTYIMWFGMAIIVLLLAIQTGLHLFEE